MIVHVKIQPPEPTISADDTSVVIQLTEPEALAMVFILVKAKADSDGRLTPSEADLAKHVRLAIGQALTELS